MTNLENVIVISNKANRIKKDYTVKEIKKLLVFMRNC
jgi:hypothetical protein